ncbi:uncharacterized protein Dsimw501_GD28417, partial [Drosophila simulans]
YDTFLRPKTTIYQPKTIYQSTNQDPTTTTEPNHQRASFFLSSGWRKAACKATDRPRHAVINSLKCPNVTSARAKAIPMCPL